MTQSSGIEWTTSEKTDKWRVFGLIGIYLIFTVVWHSLTNAPWDDDCVGRYYNVKSALSNPEVFISLWNRPLFVVLFFLPFKIIGKHAVLLMALISALSAYSLYLAAKELKIPNAFFVIPLLLFQAFFFTISRSALAEPLAAAIIAFGLLFYTRKQYLYFAIMGSLLPLARLELSLLLIFWAYILYMNGQWKYILLLAVPTIIWSLAGTYFDGDAFWLYEQTIGKDVSENRYGHTGFWHYFQRFVYVVGPLVFYFFIIGFLERMKQFRNNFFVLGQFLLGFLLYVLFSWKLNLGQAAGFLRHLAALSPLVSIIALYGYNYWLGSFIRPKSVEFFHSPPKNDYRKLNQRIEKIKKRGKRQHLSQKQIKEQINIEKQKFKGGGDYKWNRLLYRIAAYSLVMTALAFLFFSKKLVNHHTITEVTDYTIPFVIGALFIFYIALILFYRKSSIPRGLKVAVSLILTGVLMGYTLITEPPDKNNSPERRTMGDISDIYNTTYLCDHPAYVNHSWFFWANDMEQNKKKFRTLTKENLEQAGDSSVIVWESHYSHRLSGDVELDYLEKNSRYIELFRKYSEDKKFLVAVFQKISHRKPKKSLKIYDRFISPETQIASAYVNRADVKFKKMGRFDEALADYNKALKIDSTSVEAHFNKGLVFINTGRLKKAIRSFSGVINLNPDSHQAHYNIGVAYSNMKNFARAIGKYSKVIELKSDYSPAYFNRAIAYSKRKKYDQAIDDYTKVIELKGGNRVHAYYNRAMIRLQQGEIQEACKDLQKARELGHSRAGRIIRRYCN